MMLPQRMGMPAHPLKAGTVVAVGLALALISAAGSAHAEWISTRAAWQRLSPEARSAYAMGLADGRSVVRYGDEYGMSDVPAIERCIEENELTGADLALMIDAGYRHVENWDNGASSMLGLQLTRLCMRQINEARIEAGGLILIERPPPDIVLEYVGPPAIAEEE